MGGPVYVSGASEGLLDEAVVEVIIRHVGAEPHRFFGGRGKGSLLKQLGGFNAAALHFPWFVLVDLNSSAHCVAEQRRRWLPNPSPKMCFRIAIREVEAWLLADRERIAGFLGVPLMRVPHDPELLEDPKQTLVNLARNSSRVAIRSDLVPRPSAGRSEGPAYTSALSQFVRDPSAGWRPGIAAARADSLGRCLTRLESLVRECGAELG